MNKFKINILRNSIYRSPYLLSNNLINKCHLTLSYIPRCCFSSKNNNDQEYEVIDDEPNVKQPKQQNFPAEKSFFARSAIPLSLLAASGICFSIDYGFLFSLFGLSGFIGLLFTERVGLKLKKVYEDVNGKNNLRYQNLNGLLAKILLEEPQLKGLITEDALTFSNMQLNRESHAKKRLFYSKHDTYEHMQKNYVYIVRFFDVTTGADGWIQSDAVYNYDKDYYFRRVWVELKTPKQLKFRIFDNRDTIDLSKPRDN